MKRRYGAEPVYKGSDKCRVDRLPHFSGRYYAGNVSLFLSSDEGVGCCPNDPEAGFSCTIDHLRSDARKSLLPIRPLRDGSIQIVRR